ncbi:hypothetical protein CHS0354_021453 [Potamilus streckersoni]|uniref:Uncharacterized protein n=1 Tax=Potamilus streckersoni TaxID=2493646 RepID=A0AAE0S1M3_9BIVA|nr:hypothetical protein CHS0354_021453 [Potamilus streckersoni]
MGRFLWNDFKALCFLVLLSVYERSCDDKLDLSAFEYNRILKSSLELGECSRRSVHHPYGNILELCTHKRKGYEFLSRKCLNDTRLELIHNATQLMNLIGLCDGRAASYLGLLNNQHDCIATEIARRILFTRKHMTLVFIQLFRPEITRLMEDTEGIRQDYSEHYRDLYYLKDLSYGTQDVIVLEMQFSNRSMAEQARKFPITRSLVSQIADDIANNVAVPKKIKVIRLSTAKKLFYMRMFKGSSGLKDAVKLMQYYEGETDKLVRDISKGITKPHLYYGLVPFLNTSSAAEFKGRQRDEALDVMSNWEKSALLEIDAKRIYVKHRRLLPYCRVTNVENRILNCNEVIRHLKDIRHYATMLHARRGRWNKLDSNMQFTTAYSLEDRIAYVQKELQKSFKKFRKLCQYTEKKKDR